MSSDNAEKSSIWLELCANNGISYENLQTDAPKIREVEMFFHNLPRPIEMSIFENLQILRIIGQPLKSIDGFGALPRLKELWFCETELTEIKGFERYPRLEKLFLFSNKISKMLNLSLLTHLKTLWLADNNITLIENLNTLTQLEELNLAKNQISLIGHALDGMNNLESLNLAANNISSLREVGNLVRLPRVQRLYLFDPQYGSNPICHLSNYSTHILFYLPNLTRLDMVDLPAGMFVDMIQSVVLKKKMFYHMKTKSEQQELFKLLRRMENERQRVESKLAGVLRDLNWRMKMLEREQSQLEETDGDAKTSQGVTSKQKVGVIREVKEQIQSAIDQAEGRSWELEQFYEVAVDSLKESSKQRCQWWSLEHETGGNVKLIRDPPQQISDACRELIMSRFCVTDYYKFDITDVRIRRILQVRNKTLHNKFNAKVASMLGEEGPEGGWIDVLIGKPPASTPSIPKHFEYLFYVADPAVFGDLGQEHDRIIEEGFRDAETYSKLMGVAAVPLSNSLSLADENRIKSRKNSLAGHLSHDPIPFRFGQVIVSKVFLGISDSASNARGVSRDAYPKAHSVSVTTKPSSTVTGMTSGNCDCTNKQATWYIFDNELVVPEFVIEFEYVTKTPNPNVIQRASDDTNPSSLDVDAVWPELKRRLSIQDDFEMLVKPASSSPMGNLSEESVSRMRANELTVLNLTGNQLRSVKAIQSLTTLKELILSFNELASLDEVANMPNLTYLDVSFNKLQAVNGLRNVPSLRRLDLSWNQLSFVRDVASHIRKSVDSVTHLKLKFNPWIKARDVRLQVLSELKGLVDLDGERVSEDDLAAALRLTAGARISQVSILTHARTDVSPPISLAIASKLKLITQLSRRTPEPRGDDDESWFPKVTALDLDNQSLIRLSNLEMLVGLKYASFDNNQISKIEGFDGCGHLEELSLANNLLRSTDGMERVPNLKHLCLDDNFISSLGHGIPSLKSLTYLSICNNNLTSLSGIDHLKNLTELYASGNEVSQRGDIFPLKALESLVILDLSENRVTAVDNYRLFVLYHLKNLQVLDGVTTTQAEFDQSKEVLGGRLTHDLVSERLGHTTFESLRELDCSHLNLKTVDLRPSDRFHSLRSLNLEHNNLKSLDGIVELLHLKVLCLNNNHVETLFSTRRPARDRHHAAPRAAFTAADMPIFNPEQTSPVLTNLEVLFLANNGIADLLPLQLLRFPALKTLFLQGNELTKIAGLEGMSQLRELVLDKNKIRLINDNSFSGHWNLQELHLEDNRLKELNGLHQLEGLQRLYLGNNKIQEMIEVDKVTEMNNLVDLSMVNNPVTRKNLYRVTCVQKMPRLVFLDGIEVTDDERLKTSLYFMEIEAYQQMQNGMMLSDNSTMASMNAQRNYVPLKTMTIIDPLSGGMIDQAASGAGAQPRFSAAAGTVERNYQPINPESKSILASSLASKKTAQTLQNRPQPANIRPLGNITEKYRKPRLPKK